jgi:hypothetical protein
MPTKKSTRKTPKSADKSVFSKLKSLATGKAKPFLAVVVVLGVVGLGYYGYVRSNANTLNNTPPTVTCGKKLTDKECRQKQAASDTQFYAQIAADCRAANRFPTDKGCGGCQKGFVEGSSGDCRERKKVDCSAQNMIQKDDYNCGGCTSGYFLKNDVCRERTKIDCTKENRAQTDPYTCGTCKATFVESGGACVTRPVENATQLCAKAFKNYDPATNSCTTCFSTYELVGTICKKKTTTDTPLPHQPPVTPGTALTKADCDKVLRDFNTSTKQCGDCKAGYVQKGTGCAKIPGPTDQCAFNGNGRCMSPDKVKEVCKINHAVYDAKANTCKDSCVDGWYLDADVCKKISTTDSSKVKSECDKQNLRYDRETNRCLDNCKVTFVSRDGKCVEWTEASMTQYRCAALGRAWTSAVPAAGETAATAGFCAVNCPTTATKYVNTGNDDTSYCKATNNTTAGVGVAVNMTREECAKQHRAWVGALEGCSARCQNGWFLNDGKCTEVQIPAGDTTDGDSATGGCSLPLQDGICPDDDPNAPPTTTTGDQPVIHDVAVLMDHATCTALGRVWVPDANTVNGKKRGGCSTQECTVKTAEVRRSNGSAYCEGSVERISQKACLKAHRDWRPEVNACAALPGKSQDKKTKINAKQCDPPYTVYVQHTEKQGADECVKPSTFQKLQGVAQTTGKPVSYLASLPAKGLCNVQKNKQWIDGKCVKERVPSNNTNPAGGGNGATGSGEGSTQTTTQGGSSATAITAAWCAQNLGRKYDAAKKTCSRQCVASGYVITNYSSPSTWDTCQKSGASAGGDSRCPNGWHYVSAAAGCQRNGTAVGDNTNYPGSDQSHTKSVSCSNLNAIAGTNYDCISGSKCLGDFGSIPVSPWKRITVSAGQNGTLYTATDACRFGA